MINYGTIELKPTLEAEVVERIETRGRPKGTTETPYNLVKADLNQTLKLQKDIRNLVQQQVEEVKKALQDKQLDVLARLKAVELLGNILDILSKSSKETAKFILSPEGEGSKKSDDSISESQLIMELVNGGKK